MRGHPVETRVYGQAEVVCVCRDTGPRAFRRTLAVITATTAWLEKPTRMYCDSIETIYLQEQKSRSSSL